MLTVYRATGILLRSASRTVFHPLAVLAEEPITGILADAVTALPGDEAAVKRRFAARHSTSTPRCLPDGQVLDRRR